MVDRQPLVSVIITAFNRADTVGRAIASVRAQTWTSREIMVVDDASTDTTSATVQALAGDDLTLIRNPANRGIGGAKNVGVVAARGDYVAFLDSDDEWLPEKLTAQLASIERPGQPPLSFTAFYVTRSSGREVIRAPARSTTWLDATLKGVTVSLGSTLLARRALFDEVGLFNEGIRRMQDRDWILRYLDRYDDFTVEPAPLARIHNSGFPVAATVREAARALLEANRDRIARRGAAALRLFEASLRFEVAVALYREGRYAGAAGEAIGAMAKAPVLIPTTLGRLAVKLRSGDPD